MTQRDLAAEIHDYLTAHGPSTAIEIAMGVRARRADMMARLVREFPVVAAPAGANPRATYYGPSRPVPHAESGTDAAPSQSARILSVLRDGKPHTTAAIHAIAGFSRLNSRLSELRGRGYVIETERIDGVPAGPHAQSYRLVATPESAAGEAA